MPWTPWSWFDAISFFLTKESENRAASHPPSAERPPLQILPSMSLVAETAQKRFYDLNIKKSVPESKLEPQEQHPPPLTPGLSESRSLAEPLPACVPLQNRGQRGD